MLRLLPIVLIAGGLTILLIFGSDGQVGSLEAGQFAGLISLSALAIWIGMGAFHRTSLSTNIRNLVLWSGIFLALGLVYTYRFEFEQVKDRFVAALLPGNAVDSLDRNGKRQVMITRDSTGSYRVNAQANNETLNFIVDTGASITVLTSQSAQNIGIDVDSLRFNNPVSTANGITQTAITRLSSLKIGSIERQNAEVLVAQPGDLSANLLGMTFLNSLTRFSFENELLILTD